MQPPPDIPTSMGPPYDPAEAMMMLAIQAGYLFPEMTYGYNTPLGDSGGLPLVTDNAALRDDANSLQHLQHIPLPSLQPLSPHDVPFYPRSWSQSNNSVPPPPFAFVNPTFYPPVQYQAPYTFPNSRPPPPRIYPVDSPPSPVARRQLKRPALLHPNCANEERDAKRARIGSAAEALASRAFEPRIDPSRQALVAMPQSRLAPRLPPAPEIKVEEISTPPTNIPSPNPLQCITNTKDDPCPAEFFVPRSSNTSLPPCTLYTEQSLAEAWTYISSTGAVSTGRKPTHFLVLRHHVLSLIWRFAVTEDKREFYVTPRIRGNGIGLFLGLVQGFSCTKVGNTEFIFRLGMRVWNPKKSSFWCGAMVEGARSGHVDLQRDQEGMVRLKVAWDEAQNYLLATSRTKVSTISTANSETGIPIAKPVSSDKATDQASTASTKSQNPSTPATVSSQVREYANQGRVYHTSYEGNYGQKPFIVSKLHI